MAEGRETPANGPELRPPAPHLGGPLGSSGAAPQGRPANGPEKPDAATSAAQPAEPTAAEPTAAEPPPAEPPSAEPPSAEPVAAASPAPPPSPAVEPTPEPEPGFEPKPPVDAIRTAAPQPSTGPAPAPGPAQADESGPAAGPDPVGEPESGIARRADAAGDKPAVDDKVAAPSSKAADGATELKPAGPAQSAAAPTTTAAAADGKTGAKADAGDKAPAETKVGQIDLDKPAVVTVTSSSGRRVTRVLRHANPIRAARTAGRTTHAWAKRPTGRLLVPAIIAVLLIGAAGTAGAYLVPEALEAAPSPSATPGFPLDGAAPGPSAVSGAPAPSAPPLGGTAPTFPNVVGARPADALAGWAQGVGTRVAIPVVAVQAYGYAELVVTRTAPNCHLSWTTIAAIASVESSHGSANGAVLGADGSVQPPIYGLPLDGKGGRQLIRDTDQGLIDSDSTFDRAVGPLQFIPSTWNEMKVDADNSGAPDPNDIDDASLAAALYLCKGGRDLSKADAWWDAILSYNAVRPYAQKVFDAANEYGVRSRV